MVGIAKAKFLFTCIAQSGQQFYINFEKSNKSKKPKNLAKGLGFLKGAPQ